MAKSTHFEGPIPHPDIFKQYGEVIPNAPERIFRQFELDSEHAREIGKLALSAQRSDVQRAQWMAFFLVAAGILAATVLALFDKNIVAGIIAGTTLLGVLSSYLVDGKKSRSKETEIERD